jgi:hypothetical protein
LRRWKRLLRRWCPVAILILSLSSFLSATFLKIHATWHRNPAKVLEVIATTKSTTAATSFSSLSSATTTASTSAKAATSTTLLVLRLHAATKSFATAALWMVRQLLLLWWRCLLRQAEAKTVGTWLLHRRCTEATTLRLLWLWWIAETSQSRSRLLWKSGSETSTQSTRLLLLWRCAKGAKSTHTAQSTHTGLLRGKTKASRALLHGSIGIGLREHIKCA